MLVAALGDASAAVGATIAGGGGTGALWGAGPWFVAEADESDRSLLNLAPEAADPAERRPRPPRDLRLARRTCARSSGSSSRGCRRAGCWWWGPTTRRGRAPAAPRARCASWATRPAAWGARRSATPAGPASSWPWPAGGGSTVPLALAGRHNADNAACALALADWCGVPLQEAARRLAGFAGVGRRMEARGRAGGVEVVDDYAHHPAEIRATLAAARERGPGRVVVVFQPHLPSRTRALGPEIGAALGAADVVVVTDVYLAREPPDPAATGRDVAARVPGAGAGRPRADPRRSRRRGPRRGPPGRPR